MSLVKIKKGLDLPISGMPNQKIFDGPEIKSVAILGDDYIGMKPTMAVNVGDSVKLGQVLFTDKKNPSVKFTSPASGTVKEIIRGEKRVFKSLIIDCSGYDEIEFNSYSQSSFASVDKNDVVEQLLNSGLWTSIRQRPFSSIANPNTEPHSIFVNAMDTNPLAPSMDVIIEGNENEFEFGLSVLEKLTENKIFVCKDSKSKIKINDKPKYSIQEFSGPHPSGNSGTHIHFLDPVSRSKFVWYINLQDVIAIGHLFLTGKIKTEKIISLAGPAVKNPRLIKTRVGANLFDVTNNELLEDEVRIISGSVLNGRKADIETGFVGRYHQTISVLKEDRERRLFGWLTPGRKTFSVTRAYLSAFMSKSKLALTTNKHGQDRAIVPIGSYEKVMPLDILPTFLLRSLAINDLEEAEALGCLELDEEDLALCTVVCPSKIDHGLNLRRNLTLIEKEG